jgi:recombination protein RecR
MIDQLPSLAMLLKHIQQVPYVASKNIYRVANHFLDMPEERLEQFCAILLTAKNKLQHCPVCYSWQEKSGECVFCASPRRDKGVICVIQSWQEILAIEKTGGYNGVYHILGGLLCPLEGVGPDDLKIKALVARVTDETKEIILAFDQTPEGEATAAYIADALVGKKCSLSCFSRGMPVGSSLEMLDRLTVFKALSERRPW